MKDLRKYSHMNYHWNRISLEELNEIIKDKSKWDKYQQLRKEVNKEIKNNRIKKGKDTRLTYEVINDQLGDFDGVIADFGCADNELAKLRINNKVYGFDFYASPSVFADEWIRNRYRAHCIRPWP